MNFKMNTKSLWLLTFLAFAGFAASDELPAEAGSQATILPSQ